MADKPQDDDAPTAAEDAFLREVNEELRKDELTSFWSRYGRWLVGGTIGALVLAAAALYWNDRKSTAHGAVGEQFDKALDAVEAGDVKGADTQFAEIAKQGSSGYRAAALLSRANLAVKAKRYPVAIKLYEQVAKDTTLAKPWRDLALLRQTLLQFDEMKPQDVIARIAPLTTPENSFFGTAGEMKAIALMKMGRKQEAGKLFAALYKTESVPQSIRDRALRMTSVLGVDVSASTKEVKPK